MAKTKLVKNLLMGCAAVVLAGATFAVDVPIASAAVSEKSVRYYEKAKSYVEKGNVSAAIIELKNAIRSDADNVDARYELALLYLSRGNAEGAEKEFRAAMSRGYDEAKVVPRLADTYIMQGKHEQMLRDLADKALEGAAQAKLSVRRAQAHFVLGADEDARREVAVAKTIDPDLDEIYVIESWLLQRGGDLTGAEQVIDQLLSRSERSFEALVQKAELRRLQSDNEAAVDFASKSLNLNPYERRSRITRSLANAALGNVDAAMADAETLIERNGRDPFGAFMKSWALAQSGETDAALAAMAQGAGVESFPPALYLAATLHLKAGQYEQARSKIDKFLGRSPSNRRGQLTSATIAFQSGDFEAAVETLEALSQITENDVQVIAMLAAAYDQVGESAKAAALYDQATGLSPEDENLQFLSARAKIGAGDVEGGIEGMTELVDSATGGVRAGTVVFLMHLREKDYDKADVSLAKLETLTGKTKETENFRASLALGQADLVVAEQHLKNALALDETFQAARLNLARLLRVKKDMAGSKAQYEVLLAQSPGYLPAFTGLVQLAEDEGNAEESERLYRLAVDQNRNSDRANLLLVGYYLKAGSFDQSLAAAKSYVAEMPESGAAIDALARAQLALGDAAAAVSSYQRLAQIAPANLEVQLRLSRALIANKDLAGATFALDRALSLDPEHMRAKRTRVDLEQKLYGNNRAISLARRLYYTDAESNPSNSIALGQALVAFDHEREGIKLLEAVFEASDERVAFIALYAAYDQVGRRSDATGLIEKWVEGHSEDAATKLVLFSRHIGEGRHDLAIQEGEELYSAHPNNPIVLNNLAWLYEAKGRVDEALALSKKAYELAPQSGDIADTYGWILYEHGDAAEAQAMLAIAADLLPKNQTVLYHHAAALANVGKTSEALDVLKSVLSGDGDFDGRDAAATLLGELE